jgi:hypothetical protein
VESHAIAPIASFVPCLDVAPRRKGLSLPV